MVGAHRGVLVWDEVAVCEEVEVVHDLGWGRDEIGAMGMG